MTTSCAPFSNQFERNKHAVFTVLSPGHLKLNMVQHQTCAHRGEWILRNVGKVFRGAPGQIEVLSFPGPSQGEDCSPVSRSWVRHVVNDKQDLQNLLETVVESLQDRVYIVSQATTWSGLDTKWDLFELLIDSHKIDNCVLDLLQAFESRVSEKYTFRWTSSKSLASDSSQLHLGFDICYRIQYPMPNGRSNCDPWSIRQTGLYQKWNAPEKNNMILLIRPTTLVQMAVENLLPIWSDPTSVHMVLLGSLGRHWDDYIEHLKAQLEVYAQPVWFCKIEESTWPVNFNACQELELFQWKIAGLCSALKGNVDVIAMCMDRWSGLQIHYPKVEESMTGLKTLRRQLEFHRESLVALAQRAQATVNLYLRILELRHGQRVSAVSHELHDVNARSASMLSHLSDETQTLATLSRARDKDSKTVKALTAMSTFYLPASLVASIFSSNLIQLIPLGEHSQPVQLRPTSHTWIAVVLALGLMAITFTAVKLLECASRRATRRQMLPRASHGLADCNESHNGMTKSA